MVETVWPAKPEIFSIWPFKEEICHSCSKSNKDDLFNKSVTVSVPCLKVFNPSGWAQGWGRAEGCRTLEPGDKCTFKVNYTFLSCVYSKFWIIKKFLRKPFHCFLLLLG